MAEQNPHNDPKDEVDVDIDEDDDEEQKKRDNGFYINMVSKGASSGNLEDVKFGYQKQPESILKEDSKKSWTPIIWAASKNRIEVLKFLIEKKALAPYLLMDTDKYPQKCTLGKINDKLKPTPLQWACFQGNLEIVWILLKQGCRWSDVDQFGNTSVHLAACGGNEKVFESLLMIGVSCESKNSRNHSVKDLATNKNILNLIDIHLKETKCESCNISFEEKTKYWCQDCSRIYCENCFKVTWTWVSPDSTEEEKYRIDGRCIKCWDTIAQIEYELEKLMQLYKFGPLNDKIEEIERKGKQIDRKKFQAAKQLQEQLRTQDHIYEYINSLKVIESYKTIFKSVHYLRSRKEDAAERKVQLDDKCREETDRQIERLLAERKLRFDQDNFQVGNCTIEDRDELGESIEKAKEKGVANNYLQESAEMKEKMDISIEAKEIFKLFKEYQTLKEEDYPKCFYLDRKTQKIFDPETKKPADSKRWPPPKQKKKKKKKGQNILVIPDWCIDGPKQLDEKIQRLKLLLESAEDCKFDQEFLDSCNEQIKRMAIELKYRYAKTEEDRLVAEYWLAQKKKKK